MSRLEDSLNGLLKILVEHHPEWDVANPLSGLKEETVSEIRTALPFVSNELPELLGLYDFKCCCLFPFFDAFAPSEYAVRIQSLIQFYTSANSIFQDAFQGWTSSTLDSCKLDRSWRTNWIPIGEFNGDHLFIDMDPSEHGIPGQIVETHEDGKYLAVIASSISHLLDRVASNVKNGETRDSGYDDLFLDRIESHRA